MDVANKVAKAAWQFYNDPLRGTNGRYRSWEHCYKVFYDARRKRQNGKTLDYDYLCLHLAFYLASWGMYRGSSFLLQRDYKVHEEAVGEILRSDYDLLQGIKCKELANEQAQERLWHLEERLQAIYQKIRNKVVKQCEKGEPKADASSVFISKILMGTLGCVPAYDRFFRDGIKGFGVNGSKGFGLLTGIFNKNSVRKLIDFYEINLKSFEEVRHKMSIGGLEYPQMKLLDMGFWQIGKENDEKQKTQGKNEVKDTADGLRARW